MPVVAGATRVLVQLVGGRGHVQGLLQLVGHLQGEREVLLHVLEGLAGVAVVLLRYQLGLVHDELAAERGAAEDLDDVFDGDAGAVGEDEGLGEAGQGDAADYLEAGVHARGRAYRAEVHRDAAHRLERRLQNDIVVVGKNVAKD